MRLLPAYTSEQNMLSEFSFSVPDREMTMNQNEKTQMTPVKSVLLTVCQACLSNCSKKNSQILKYRKCYISTAHTYTFRFLWLSYSIFYFLFQKLKNYLQKSQCSCSLCYGDQFQTRQKLFSLCKYLGEIICQNQFHKGFNASYSK